MVINMTLVNPISNAFNFFLAFLNAIPMSVRAFILLVVALFVIVGIIRLVRH